MDEEDEGTKVFSFFYLFNSIYKYVAFLNYLNLVITYVACHPIM